MTSWGRNKEKKPGGGSPSYRRFAISAAAVAACLSVMTFRGLPAKEGDVSVLRSEELAVTDAIRDTGAVPVLLTIDGGGDEPPGMINGRWNLWEYIGDKLADVFVRR